MSAETSSAAVNRLQIFTQQFIPNQQSFSSNNNIVLNANCTGQVHIASLEGFKTEENTATYEAGRPSYSITVVDKILNQTILIIKLFSNFYRIHKGAFQITRR